MPLKSAVTYCQIDDSFAAGKFAVEAVIQKLDGHRPDMLLLFTTVGHNIPRLLQGIQAVAGDLPLCGCSGFGIITHLGCDEATFSLALMGLKSDEMSFYPFIVPKLSAEPKEVGTEIGEQIRSLGLSLNDKKLLFLFPDGFTINADCLFEGIEKRIGYKLDFVGGTAGNDYQSFKTYQICNQDVMTDAVAGVLISGDFKYTIAVSHGSKPIGNFRTITKAQANVIYEIDHQPALNMLKHFVGEERFSDFCQVNNLIGLGQAFEGKGYSENIIIRAITGIDKERGSIQIGSQIPVGTRIRLTRRDKLKVVKGTKAMAQKILETMHSPEKAAYFYFNCDGRGSYLFGEPEPDVNSLLETLGDDKELIGFFSFGEIAPVAEENHFHNYTGVLVGIE